MHQITRPLPDIHPEFTVVHWPGFTEYRVAHYRLASDGSGKIVHGTSVWSWFDAGLVAFMALVVRAWFAAREHGHKHGPAPSIPVLAAVPRHVLLVGVGIMLAWLVWARCTQILHESLLVFPTLGIQLETHRGHPLVPCPFSVTRHFIPLSALEDVVLHEGFRRWNVRYYLAALQRRKRPLASMLALASESGLTADGRSVDPPSASEAVTCPDGEGIIEVHVAFENILPHFPVLHAVYLGVQETFFSPHAQVVEPEVETDGHA